jgi:uncharacterized protein HemX
MSRDGWSWRAYIGYRPEATGLEGHFDFAPLAGMISARNSREYPFITIGGSTMRRITVVALAAVLALGLAGCGGKEKEELRQKVANLEQQLAKATSQVAEKEAAMASMETSLKQAQDEVAKCKVERDKLKAEVAQLKKKTGTTTKKK